MTKTIEQLACEAGINFTPAGPSDDGIDTWYGNQYLPDDALNRFAALVRADERKNLPVIETCDRGHRFGFLPDHPRDSGGLKRCPHCLAIGLDAERGRTAELEKAIRDANSWLHGGEGIDLVYYHLSGHEDDSKAVLDALVEKP